MLSPSFYSHHSSVVAGEKLTTTLVLQSQHEIFKGHFPGMPVVPGVCMMEMVKELMEEVIAKHTRLKKSTNLKFLHILDPGVHPEIQAELKIIESPPEVSVSAKLFYSDITFFKMDAKFIVE